MSAPEFNRKTGLESLIQSLDSSLGLGDARCFNINAKIMTSIGKLSKGVLVIEGVVFSFVFKNGTSVGIEHSRNAVIKEDLIEDIVVAFEGLLIIEIGTNDFAGGIIDSEMEMPYLATDPLIA